VRRLILSVMTMALPVLATTAFAQETPGYEVVTEYVRQLGAIRNIQQTAAQATATLKNQTADVTSSNARIQQELRAGINAFRAMKLNPPHGTLLLIAINFYEQKIKLYGALADLPPQSLPGSPGARADPAKPAAPAANIAANIQYIDKALFDTSPLFFALLMEPKPDKQRRLNQLAITTAQRNQLIEKINGLFGESLNASDQNYTVRTASVLRADLLNEDYKSSDDAARLTQER
jgi:hypothetical protein